MGVSFTCDVSKQYLCSTVCLLMTCCTKPTSKQTAEVWVHISRFFSKKKKYKNCKSGLFEFTHLETSYDINMEH